MADAQVLSTEVQKVLRYLMEGKRLSNVVKMMAREIERLHEENAQLHAAVATCREAERRHACRVGELQ